MTKNINLGGCKLRLETIGVDESLEKLNLLILKLIEAKSLIDEIASIELDINFLSSDVIND